MNKLEAMTWPSNSQLGQDGNEINIRFDSHDIREHDVITHNYRSNYTFRVMGIIGNWVTCRFISINKYKGIPDGEITVGSQFKILMF